MNSPPDGVYAIVRDTDPDVLDADQLDAFQRNVAELRAWCDAREVRSTRRRRQLANEGRAADSRCSLTRDGRRSSKDAQSAADRETMCTAMPGFEEALAAGSVSAGHIDALAIATRNLDTDEAAEFTAEAETLIGDAERMGVDSFARNCRELAKGIRAHHNARADVEELEEQRRQSKITRWIDRQTGMHKTLVECDPLTDRQIWSAIQRERDRLRRRSQQTGEKPSWDRLTVDALVAATTSSDSDGPRSGRGGRDGVVVHVDIATLTDGRHDGTLCETDSGAALPVDTVRRMACDAKLLPTVLNGRGVVLDQGRAKRLATVEQRAAIEAMQSTCSHPDCTVSVDDCRVHQIVPWQRGGPTDLDNLAPLCEPHHHLVHEGGWSMTMTSDRVATWTQPDGHEYWSGSVIDRTPVLH